MLWRENFGKGFLNKVVPSFLQAFNVTYFHVTSFIYCLEGRGRCLRLLPRVPSESFYVSKGGRPGEGRVNDWLRYLFDFLITFGAGTVNKVASPPAVPTMQLQNLGPAVLGHLHSLKLKVLLGNKAHEGQFWVTLAFYCFPRLLQGERSHRAPGAPFPLLCSEGLHSYPSWFPKNDVPWGSVRGWSGPRAQ